MIHLFQTQGLRRCVEEIVFSFTNPRLDIEVYNTITTFRFFFGFIFSSLSTNIVMILEVHPPPVQTAVHINYFYESKKFLYIKISMHNPWHATSLYIRFRSTWTIFLKAHSVYIQKQVSFGKSVWISVVMNVKIDQQ